MVFGRIAGRFLAAPKLPLDCIPHEIRAILARPQHGLDAREGARQEAGNHLLSIPARKPVKPIYIKKLAALLARIGG